MTASFDPAANESTSDREIVITRLLDAPRELAFSAWTDPEKVVKWWGPISSGAHNSGLVHRHACWLRSRRS